ncbi:acylamino-acid-releasing enzyme-like isoform X2 [Pithys albifrons albifrons]|uniref:acylamino-acid-releasing enzyme-like isoform X2 n=1 Tax=Pithys albifrons albifrons TaxID=3385563 RepID=UPI003A5CF6DB
MGRVNPACPSWAVGSSWRAGTSRGAGARLFPRALADIPLPVAGTSSPAWQSTAPQLQGSSSAWRRPAAPLPATGSCASSLPSPVPPSGPRLGDRPSYSTRSAGAPTCPAAASCASAATTVCGARTAAPASPSPGPRSAPTSTASTAGTGFAGGRLLGQDSPSGQRRALFSHCPLQGHELLEVWDRSGRSHSVDLTALGKHSEVYTEGPFACLAWSHLETRLLYVAEKSQPKRQPSYPWDVPGAAGPAQEDEDEEGEKFMYHEDWGEALSTRSMPVLCILDLESSNLSVLEGVPEHLSPGQALWSPDDRGVVFVGWWHKPFRLGLRACSNRRSGIFHLDLASGRCELLSADNVAACSPRLSPDGQRLLYLEGSVGGPHRQCLRLCLLTWQTRQTVTVIDVVQEPTEAFTGLYTEVLPPQCWAADSRRAVLSTPQRSRTDLLLVDTEAATVTNLTAGSPEGCWELLTLQWDLLVATCSAPHHPPSLVVAMLPPAGQELPLCWVPVENTPTVPGVTWKTLMIQPPCSGQGSTAHNTQDFEALLLSPSDGTAPHPLVVCPHGGPHAVFDARWRPSMAALCQLGFAVLLGECWGPWGHVTPCPTGNMAPMAPVSPVNYRGSLGFGQASISSLLSRVGEQDVADTQLAVEQALHSEPLDPHRLALLAGSHGAFIALHLLTREPERYQACALRSPVSNLPALLGTSDIPDWRYTSLGLPYSFERVPRAEEVATMLLRSPIAQAAQGCAAGADARAALCGRQGPARQPHTGAGALPGAAGQRRASTAAVVPGGRPCADRRGDRGQCLQELCPLVPPAPWAAQAGQDRTAQPLSASGGPGLCWPQGDHWP